MKECKNLRVALSRLIVKQPFFAVLLLRNLKIEVTDVLHTPGGPIPNETAATDGKTIFVNPGFFDGMTVDECVFVLAHEVLHFMFSHLPRAKGYRIRGFGPDLQAWNAMKWNIAGDYVINAILIAAGVGKMPSVGLYDRQFNGDELVDDVYANIIMPDDPSQPGSGGEGDEGSEGGHGGFDKHIEPKAGTETDPNAVRQAIVDAANAAKAQGQMPAVLEQIVDIMTTPSVDWKTLLRDEMVETVGNDTVSRRRIHRRKLAVFNQIWPGRVGHLTGGLVIGLDESGSVSPMEFSQFLSELQSIIEDTRPEWIRVYHCDTRVAHITDIDNPEEVGDVKRYAVGGTYMPAIFDKIDEEGDEPETCVILTDGYTDFGPAQPYKVIWGITSENMVADHGITIHVEITEKEDR